MRCANLGSDKIVAWSHGATLYWGTVTSATAITWDQATTTTSINFQSGLVLDGHMQSDGTKLLIMGSRNAGGSTGDRWEMEIWDIATRTLDAKYVTHYVNRGSSVSTGLDHVWGIIKIDGVWCVASFRDGTIWVQSQDLLSDAE